MTGGQSQVLRLEASSALGSLSLSFPSRRVRAIILAVQPEEHVRSHSSTAEPLKARSMKPAGLFAFATSPLGELGQIT